MLIIVEDGHFTTRLQRFFNREALWGAHVFYIDTAEAIGDARDRVDEAFCRLCVDLDVHAIEIGESFEE